MAVNPSAPGYLTAYPCSTDRPETSTVNFVGAQTVANNTIAALSSAGQLCVWTSADTDIIVDITGWLGPSGSSRFTPIGPTRVVDTRSAIGGLRLPAGSTLSVDFNGFVPAGSTAVALNVTAVDSSTPGYLTVYPCGGSLPQTSTVNHVAAEARPEQHDRRAVGGPGVHLQLRPERRARRSGRIVRSDRLCVQADGAGSGDRHPSVPPAGGRAGDRRLQRGRRRRSVATSRAAAFVNVTATNHAVPGYVTTYDCGVRRETSTLNQQVGQTAANGAIVPLAANLQSCAWMFGGGHLIVDLNGWWVP